MDLLCKASSICGFSAAAIVDTTNNTGSAKSANSRKSINLRLTSSENPTGVKLSFNYLDFNDGMRFEIQHTGSYKTKIKRLVSNKIPNLFLLVYNKEQFNVSDFFVIPSHFFIPEIVEKRKPLSTSARRAGWVGSNILLNKIP